MSGNSLLIDTNILLYLLGGDESLIPVLEDKQIFISFITQIEVLGYHRLTDKERKKTIEFLEQCTIIDITSGIKEKAIKIRRELNLKLPDCIISATAIYLNIPIFTADKDYKNIKEADILFYQK